MSRSDSPKRRHTQKPKRAEKICRTHTGHDKKSKICYSTRKKALTAMNFLIAHPPTDTRVPSGIYKCPACHDWHLTSKESA